MIQSSLILPNGNELKGTSPHWQEGCTIYGELVFTTGMTGYLESLTDPSYKDQILVFTYPLIGNYGVCDPKQWESKKIHAAAVVVSESCTNWSHHSGLQSLELWLKAQNVPLIMDVDTRKLTRLIRTGKASEGQLLCGSVDATNKTHSISKRYPVSEVSISKIEVYNSEQETTIIAVDCGMKENIIRELCKLPVKVIRVPFDYDYSQDEFDGIFLSNGPGDPTDCQDTVAILKQALKKEKPIFGICLGAQLMALAVGAETYKLDFGHRGHNQPCMELETKRCFITSQNHGYAIKESTLPIGWKVSYRNLNDDSVEGIQHESLPFSSVQFHPEAAPGPVDTMWLFNEFYEQVAKSLVEVRT